MAKSQRDIEYEMSRFEEEITKLIPAAPTPAVISAAPVNTYSIKPRSVGNMGMPSTIGNMGMPSSFSSVNFQQPSMYAGQISQPAYVKPAMTTMPMVPRVVSDQSSAIKRDSAGNLKGQTQQKPAITPSTSNAANAGETDNKKFKKHNGKNKKFVRSAGGQTWEDESLAEWDNDDFRLFCGDLGNEVNDESLSRAFQKYPSFQKGKVIRDKKNGKTKGYGFVSFKDADDFIKAMREMNGKYVGNRPIKLRKSNWQDRNIDVVRKKQAEKERMGLR